MDGFELITIQAETLYTYDVRGRTVRDNYPGGGSAPRLFVGRSTGGDAVRCNETMPERIMQRLATLLAREPRPRRLGEPLRAAEQIRVLLSEHAPVTAEGGGPTYSFPDQLPQPSGAVRITEANRSLVQSTFPDLYATFAQVPICYAVLQEGAAVSVCFSSRVGPRATEAEVATLPDFRGRGYAVQATVAWGQAVRAAGGIPLYTTSWENLASQGVARRAGLTMYGAFNWWI